MFEALTTLMMLQRSITRALENFKKIGKANLTAAKIQARLAALEKNWESFNEGHAALVTATSPSVKANLAYFTEDNYDNVEDAFLTAKDFMVDCLAELEPPVSPTSRSSLNAEHAGPATSAVSLSHLPPIKLPPFDGNYDDWESFRDRFTALILSNAELNDFARMHFLISSLKGRALDAIRDLSVTADNLKLAWDTLTTRFENKRRLISSHLSALLSLTAVKRESATDLQTLTDRAAVAISSLKNLGRAPAELWNDILVHIISHKLDSATLKAWTLANNQCDDPLQYDDLRKFLSCRIRALEEIASDSSTMKASAPPPIPSRHVHVAASTTKGPSACPLCQSRHYLHACAVYLAKSPSQRRDIVQNFKRCFNCLSHGHAVPACRSQFVCRFCQRKHHTSLHDDSTSGTSPAGSASTVIQSDPVNLQQKEVTSLFTATGPCSARVLLATAWIKVGVPSGRTATVRALLDQGSEVSFMTERLAQTLRVQRIPMPITISAVGDVPVGTVRHAASIAISARHQSAFSVSTTVLILPTLTAYPPQQTSYTTSLNYLNDLPWADPNPTSSHPIDIILGADLFSLLILDGVRKGRSGQPIAQNSIFGWVISGPLSLPLQGSCSSLSDHPSANLASPKVSTLHCLQSASLADELRRFWEVEELPRQPMLSPQERQCEEHFLKTHSRAPDGRYIVRLPFKQPPPLDLGQSRFIAEKRLLSLKRKFQSQPNLESEYREFLAEYEDLGHMRPLSAPFALTTQSVYIPHHPVVREGSATTHLRVVFNASSLTSNGSSLNDHLLAGPKLQTDLPAVILQWRHFRFVYSADIAKMYRQIRVDDRDVDYQRILWSRNQTEPPRDYQLLTVTYGMTCAPFLALRVLQRLVEDEGTQFPLAVPILREGIYVDDVLFGGDDPDSTRQARDDLVALLHRGKFNLRKWASNNASLLDDIDPSNHGLACTKHLAADDSVKVLGIGWNPSLDAFQIYVDLPKIIPRTKRTILSIIAKLYDPLGWVTPVTVTAKAFMQQLWRLQLNWDDTLPDSILSDWEQIFSDLEFLRGLYFSRWTGLGADSVRLELHGFADASTVAYAAVVYLKVISSSGSTTVTLLAGKSKVAPIKPLTIPRLELSAAVLLVRLMEFVRKSFVSRPCSYFCWTDSTIVLAWLRDHPSRWKTFIANRVHEIQTRLADAEWRHVPTHDNPADCASRGIRGREIRNHKLWWDGPSWLLSSSSEWPHENPALPVDAPLEEKRISLHSVPQPALWDLSTRFSSWSRLIRVTAYMLRFCRNCRNHDSRSTSSSDRCVALSADECSAGRLFWIKQMQSYLFPTEIRALSDGKPLSSKSAIRALLPFLDTNGVLRVGGRLKNAPIPLPVQHPILLAPHPLVELIIRQTHLRGLHAGLQLTLNSLRQEFWVLRARSLVKKVIYNCVACVRERAAPAEQLMGNLPRVRVTPTLRCFVHCGVDYAGPIHIRASAGRGIASRKAYIALFICLTTRAIHLELVGDYTTSAFMNTFARFCARRGLPQSVYSDNGTTFVGADRELHRAYRAALRDPAFQNKTACDKVEWHFIPPSAPHFGGLWEAGVRSVKHHLRRVLGNHTLTFEEFTNLLCRIEACLNSRPLAPLTDALDDYTPLTPGHFLVGSALTVAPEPSVLHLSENRLSRWQLVQHLTERLWKLWQTDFVNTLQQRNRWKKLRPAIKIGQLVLLRNSNLPPCKWELGRVTQLHTGSDGLTRVVTVKTATSEFKRPIVQICVLPVTSETAIT